jgi:protein tyrosine phosphatase (PTP) superfamily phosphohydrolase (DUF442 family)
VDDSNLHDIYKYRRAEERIATAGQPTVEQLAAVAAAGCSTVINLGLHDADYALHDERGTVESLGMTYVHIPVAWDHPTPEDLARFSQTVSALEGQDLFVHCAANVRVTVFIALDRIARQGWAPERAMATVDLGTLPPAWQQFISDVLARH